MAKISRFKLKNSERSGFKEYEIDLIKDNSYLVMPDEFDTPPPSNKSLGGEGEVSGDPRANSQFDISGTSSLSSNVTYLGSSVSTLANLLIHANGVDGSTTFPDSSSSQHMITANGNAQVDTSQYEFGGASALFDGSGDYLSVPDSENWNFGTGDFTLDCWVRVNSFAGAGATFPLVGQTQNSSNFWFIFLSAAAIELQARVAGVDVIRFSKLNATSLATWYHIAVIRTGTTFRIFVNGTQVGTDETDASAMPDLSASLFIGADGLGDFGNGWIDELRVVKGTAVWTTDFTPPTSEYPSFEIQLVPNLSQPWMLISGSNQNVVLNDVPQILAGRQSQILSVQGVGSSVTISNGNGVQLMGGSPFSITSGAIINFIYNSGNTVWQETSRFRP